MEETEKKQGMELAAVKTAYIVKIAVDGSVDVEDLPIEGAENQVALTAPDIYKSIKEVADLISKKEVSDISAYAAYNGTMRAMNDFYNKLSSQQAEAVKPVSKNTTYTGKKKI